jgi:hypothetical protein
MECVSGCARGGLHDLAILAATLDGGACRAANGGYADVVAAGEFVERSALRASSGGLLLLCRCQGRGSAHALPALLRPAAALGGAGADKVALDVGEPSEDGNHQPPRAGAGVGPRLRG